MRKSDKDLFYKMLPDIFYVYLSVIFVAATCYQARLNFGYNIVVYTPPPSSLSPSAAKWFQMEQIWDFSYQCSVLFVFVLKSDHKNLTQFGPNSDNPFGYRIDLNSALLFKYLIVCFLIIMKHCISSFSNSRKP